MDVPGFNINTDDLVIQIIGNVTHKPGAIRLDGYPSLVYAPKHWGPGVRLNDNGVEVELIYHAWLREDDIAELAWKFQTDEGRIQQAIDYARSIRKRGV